jgi:protein-ribulosamine 3-kinase
MDAALRRSLGIEAAEKLAGGGVLECHWVTIAGAERFLKTGAARYADAFAAEADGLEALRAAGARAPQALAHGVAGGKAYLLIEHLELQTNGDYAALGSMLAALHRSSGARFGWQRDNYIGATPQVNSWCDDWGEFWLERRMRPQLTLAERNGFKIEDLALEKILLGHKPQPSLLHGDLWNGNAGFNSGAPVIFDPAVYYGDRECDLAMTELFGGFPAEFYSAYQKDFPLDAGYRTRKHLYNLYHLLNHLNIFGGGYLGQVKATLGLLRGLLK